MRPWLVKLAVVRLALTGGAWSDDDWAMLAQASAAEIQKRGSGKPMFDDMIDWLNSGVDTAAGSAPLSCPASPERRLRRRLRWWADREERWTQMWVEPLLANVTHAQGLVRLRTR